ncbi:MAG: UTP--glucose-1-phosphate uridylyltransferase [Myxococcota bacterium]
MAEQKTDELGLTVEERRFLARYGFDADTFARLKADLAAGEFPPERNRITHTVAPPEEGDLRPWPKTGTNDAATCERIGFEAIEKGKVAVVILNGGMATRFGGRVKGVVEVIDNKSFLELKLGDVARARGPVATFVMNSFATEADTESHLKAIRRAGLPEDRIHLLTQRVSVRLTPSGDVVRDDKGKADFYAPGHGDVLEVLAESEAFQRFVAAGGRTVMVSNVDNLAATLLPKIVGAHLDGGKKVTVEVAPRVPGDKGGAPVRINGRVEILEAFRFPDDFDLASLPVFNTNTLLLDVSAVRTDYALTWFRTDKESRGRKVVQFERLMGEVTAFVDATYLEVERVGPEGRFLPVKTPDDLIAIRPVVRDRFAGLT